MSTFSIEPRLTIVAFQAFVFLANLFVVKKFFVEPYLSLIERRAKKTTGSDDEAKTMLNKASELTAKVTARMQAAMSEAAGHRQTLLEDASGRREALIKSAESKARQELEAMQTDLRQQTEMEKKGIPALVNKLAAEVAVKVLS